MNLRSLVAGVSLVFFQLCGGAAETARYTGPIIDVHLHAMPTKQLQGLRRGLARPEMATSEAAADRAAVNHDRVLAASLSVPRIEDLPELDEDGHFKATLAAMDRFNIVRGMVSG